MMISPLITAAKHSAKRETVINYVIATAAGIILGSMLALYI